MLIIFFVTTGQVSDRVVKLLVVTLPFPFFSALSITPTAHLIAQRRARPITRIVRLCSVLHGGRKRGGYALLHPCLLADIFGLNERPPDIPFTLSDVRVSGAAPLTARVQVEHSAVELHSVSFKIFFCIFPHFT